MDEVTRSEANKRRAVARSDKIRKLREKSITDNGSSPDLPDRRATGSQISQSEDEDEVVVIPDDKIERPSKARMADDMKAFAEAINAKLDRLPTSQQFEAFGCKIEKNELNIAENTKRLANQELQLSKISESVARIERDQIDAHRGLERKIKTAVCNLELPRDSTRTEATDFDLARRSMRLWPVPGRTKDEMEKSAIEFISGALLVEDMESRVGKIVNVKRIPDRERSLIFDEVSVEFESKAIRDYIASRGVKLASFIDGENRPTCGIRMEIPELLVPTFNLLKKYGFCLKKNNANMKSYVKFDDFKRSLFLQVRIDKTEGEWLNIQPEEAHEAMKKYDAKRTARVRSLLSSPNNSNAGRDRPESVDGESVRMEIENERRAVEIPEERSSWRPSVRKK